MLICAHLLICVISSKTFAFVVEFRKVDFDARHVRRGPVVIDPGAVHEIIVDVEPGVVPAEHQRVKRLSIPQTFPT